MYETYFYPAIRNVRLPVFDTSMRIGEFSFLEFCARHVEDPDRAEATDFYHIQQAIGNTFGWGTELNEKALRYFFAYIMSRGYAPMNFANAVDLTYEYGPITKYGLRPQEIIDNLIADWRSRGGELFEPYEVMFGWEHDCGLFMEDDEEEPGN